MTAGVPLETQFAVAAVFLRRPFIICLGKKRSGDSFRRSGLICVHAFKFVVFHRKRLFEICAEMLVDD